MTADGMRLLIIGDMIAMGFLASVFLSGRRLSIGKFLLWGLLVGLPIVGPYVVILERPGNA